jgi:hypothetical protein
VLAILLAIREAADAVADEVVKQLGRLASDTVSDDISPFLARGRGLLSHGVGRLTLHQIGRRLGIASHSDIDPAFRRIFGNRSETR